MILLVLLSVLDMTVIQQWDLEFGSLPGLNSYINGCPNNQACSINSVAIIWTISYFAITLVWIVLGGVIMSSANRHLTRVAIAGLCAIGLFNTIPSMENIPQTLLLSFSHVSPLRYVAWLLLFVIALLPIAALFFIALAGRRGQLKSRPLLRWAIILLGVSAFIQIVYGTFAAANMAEEPWLYYLPRSIFAAVTLVPWIIVAATARPQPARMSTTPAAVLATS